MRILYFIALSGSIASLGGLALLFLGMASGFAELAGVGVFGMIIGTPIVFVCWPLYIFITLIQLGSASHRNRSK